MSFHTLQIWTHQIRFCCQNDGVTAGPTAAAISSAGTIRPTIDCIRKPTGNSNRG